MLRARPYVSCALLALSAAVAGHTPARAQAAPEQPRTEEQSVPRFEAWAGAQAFHRIWSVYGGGTYAPFGSVREDGWRLRTIAGYSDYTTGTVAFTELLLGYHKQLGPLTIKFLAGLTGEDRHADDPSSTLEGAAWGAKAVLETWWTITDLAWLSADLSWGSLQTSYGARVRLGWRFTPAVSAGLEGGATGTVERDIARAGGFVRYEWATGEASLSAGMAFDDPKVDWESHSGAFGTLSILMRF